MAETNPNADLPSDIVRAFEKINKTDFETQACFFLNAFWDEWGEKNVEKVWKWGEDFMAVDLEAWVQGGKKKQAYVPSDSLELQFAMKFLEKQGKALSPVEYKTEFKQIDINFDGCLSLLEWALHETKFTVKTLIEKPQATTPEYEAAKKKYDECKAELDALQAKKDAAKIKAQQSGTGMKALRAKQEWEEVRQIDAVPLERALIKAEGKVKKEQKKIKPPAGDIWWKARKEEEAAKYGKKAKK
eukprot:gb/GEZN01010078.1/.p1 GENE.gb/GEZN01010078.1/~~gb/GEZN01010078.1/.p1  ORF type:complete len:244 (-),score=76.46 gb/GEZN01010078.1/:516-1247(-)